MAALYLFSHRQEGIDEQDGPFRPVAYGEIDPAVPID